MSVLNRYSYVEEFSPSPGGGEQSSSPPSGGLKQMFEENRRRHLMAPKQPEINRHLPRTDLSRPRQINDEVSANTVSQGRARSFTRDSVIHSPSVPPPPPPPPPAPVFTSNTKPYDQNVIDPGVLIAQAAQAIAERLKNANNDPNILAMKQRKTTPLAQVKTPMTFMEELHRALLAKRQSSDMNMNNEKEPEIRVVQPAAVESHVREDMRAQPEDAANPSRFLQEVARKKFEEATNEFEAKSVVEQPSEDKIKPLDDHRIKEQVHVRENDLLRESSSNFNANVEDNFNVHVIVEEFKTPALETQSGHDLNDIDTSRVSEVVMPIESEMSPVFTQSVPLVHSSPAEEDEMSKYLKSIHTSFVSEVNEPNDVAKDHIDNNLSNLVDVNRNVPDANEVVKVAVADTYFSSNPLKHDDGSSNVLVRNTGVSTVLINNGNASNVGQRSDDASNAFLHSAGTSNIIAHSGGTSNVSVHNNGTNDNLEHSSDTSNLPMQIFGTTNEILHNDSKGTVLVSSGVVTNFLVAESLASHSLPDASETTILEVNKVSSDVLKSNNYVTNYFTLEATDSRIVLLEPKTDTNTVVVASNVTTNDHDVSTDNEEERVLRLLDLACADSNVASSSTLNNNTGNGWNDNKPLSYNRERSTTEEVRSPSSGPTYQLPQTFVNIYTPNQRSDVNTTYGLTGKIEPSKIVEKAQPIKQKRFDTPIFRPPNAAPIDHSMPNFVNSIQNGTTQETGNTIQLKSNRFIKNGSNKLKDGHLERSINNIVNNQHSKVNEGSSSAYHRRKKYVARMENETKYSEERRQSIYNKIQNEVPVLYDLNHQGYSHSGVEIRHRNQTTESQPAVDNFIENRNNRHAVYSKLALSPTDEHLMPSNSTTKFIATDSQYAAIENPKRFNNNPSNSSSALVRIFKSAKDAIKSWRRDSRVVKQEQVGPYDINARGPLEGSYGNEFQADAKMIRGYSDRYHPVTRPKSMNGLLQTRSLTRLSQHNNRNSFGSNPGLNMPSTPNFALFRPTMSPFPHDPCRDVSPGFPQSEVKYALNGGCIHTLQSFNAQPTTPAIFQKLVYMSHATNKYVDSPNFVLESLAPVNVSGGYSSAPNSPRLFTVTGATPTHAAGFRSTSVDSTWHPTPPMASPTSSNWHPTPQVASITVVTDATGYDTRM